MPKDLPQNNDDAFAKVEIYEPPLKEHIKELRSKLFWCFITIVISFFIIFTFYVDLIMQFLTEPIKARGIQFVYLGLAETLTAQMKVSLIAAMIISSPIIFWQIWGFIKPALYDNEKKEILLFSIGSMILFVLGVIFGYGVVFLSAISFFVYMGENLATPMLSISQYVGFLFGFVLSFGIVFELPIVTYLLCRLGLVTVGQLVAIRKYMVLVIFIIAAFLTPPDVLSQILMTLPMLVLYEIGILVAKIGCR